MIATAHEIMRVSVSQWDINRAHGLRLMGVTPVFLALNNDGSNAARCGESGRFRIDNCWWKPDDETARREHQSLIGGRVLPYVATLIRD